MLSMLSDCVRLEAVRSDKKALFGEPRIIYLNMMILFEKGALFNYVVVTVRSFILCT